MEERIVIEVVDKIPTSIEKKLKGIGIAAEVSALKLERAKNATAISAERLTQAQRKSEIEMQRLARATAQAETAILRLQRAQDRLASSNKASKSGGGFALPGKGALVGGLAAVGIGLGAKEIIDLGNEYVTLTNKIKVVTDSENQQAAALERVFSIANTTRTSVSDTATAFQRLDMALKPLGASQEETLRMTETINKAFILGGASTQEAAGALRQLTQAFNAGKLAGDEYRSVSENAPIIMEALSRSLNKTKGELKEMSAEGKITSEVLRKAIGEAEILIDARFSKTVPTMGQAVEVLKNKLIELFGEIEKNSGVLSGISSSIISISKNVNELIGPISTMVKSLDGFRKLLNIGADKFDGWLVLRRIIQFISLDIAVTTDRIADLLSAISGLAKTAKNITPTGSAAGSLSNLFFGKDYVNNFADATYNLSKSLKGSESNFNLTLDRIAADEEVIKKQREQNKLIDEQQKIVEKLAKSYEQLDRLKAPQAQQDVWKKKWEDAKAKLIALQGGDLSSLRKPGEGTGIGNVKGVGNKKGKSNGLGYRTGGYLESIQLDLLPEDKEFRKAVEGAAKTLSEYNLDMETAIQLSSRYGSELENLTKLKDLENKLAQYGFYLTPEEQAARLVEIEQVRQLNLVQAERNSILDQTIGRMEKLDVLTKGVKDAVQLGVDPNEALLAAFPDLLGGTQIEEDIRIKKEKERFDALKKLASENSAYADALRQATTKKELTENQKRLGYAQTFFDNMSTLQQSGSKEGFELGKAAALASAGIQSTMAILGVWGDATIPTWAKGPLAASIAAMTAVQVANIASAEFQPKGFEAGGYTGDMGTKDVAGVVHGREFVVNAAATARNRATLEAMNSGKSVGNGIQVNIENYGTSKEFEVQNDEGRIRIIARDEVTRMVPDLVSAEIANPNSKTSKSFARNTNLTRQR